MSVVHEDQLGAIGMGGIDPDLRVGRGEITAERVDELTERLKTDEFYDDISDELGPNAAGGTFTLVVADALTSNRFRTNGENAKEHAMNVYSYLMENCNDDEHRKFIPRVCVDGRIGNYQNPAVIGGHDDEHGPAGCGAQGKLGPILSVIRDHGDALRKFAGEHGVEVDDDTHGMIVDNAGKLLATGYVVEGAELRDAFVKTEGAGEQSVTTLLGAHTEVVASLNTEPGKTLNRRKVQAEFGDDYKVFNVDLHALPAATGTIAPTVPDGYQKFVASVYYQVATTAFLAGPSLRIADR